jgi:2',3'-cyclic-nucleotide 2'-phosphodiesterase (5'-nucleotidase family)
MIDETKRLVGGMEASSHYINELREAEQNTLLIDTGDVMTGTLATKIEYNGVNGGVMMEFMNLLGYDVWCLGNHAFDQGYGNAKALLSLASFPTVLCNLVDKDTKQLFAPKPYDIFKVGRLRVGVIGVMEERFMIEVDKKYTEGLEVLPVVPTLNSYIPELDEQSDLIIVLVHGKFNVGENVARGVTGIDLILIAHENGQFKELNGILLKSTFGHQRTLGTLVLKVKDDGIHSYEQDLKWLWADVDLSPDPEISALVRKFDASVKAEYDRIIGVCEFDRTREGSPVENVLGNWITDAMRWKTGVDIAFQNSGGIRADVIAGPITIADIHAISPFNNTLVVFEMTGKEVKQALEIDVERGWDRLQISGIKYRHYPKEMKPQGQRVDYVEVGGDVLVDKGEVLLPDRIYTVTTNDYVFNMAEEKYFGFSPDLVRERGLLLTQVLTDWMEKYEVLVCEIEDRITLLK